MELSLYQPVIGIIERVPDVFLPLIRTVPQHIVKRRPAPGTWSAHEHACHLAAVQPLFFERLDLMLTNDHPAIAPWFPGPEDEDGAMLARDLDAELRRFEEDRKRLVGLLKDLEPEDWDRTADHGEYNRYSIFILFRHVALHDMLHAYRIEELLLKKDWNEA